MFHVFPQTAFGGQKSPYALVLVKFETLDDLHHVYSCIHDRGLQNEDKQDIKFGIAYDTRCTGETKWVGVILRNLPMDASVGGILKNFKSP